MTINLNSSLYVIFQTFHRLCNLIASSYVIYFSTTNGATNADPKISITEITSTQDLKIPIIQEIEVTINDKINLKDRSKKQTLLTNPHMIITDKTSKNGSITNQE